MRITGVEALYLRLPEIQARTDSSQDALIVRVATDAGITGWGEVDGCPWVTKAIIDAPMSHTLVTGLRALLIGEDPLETARLWRKMYDATLYYGREPEPVRGGARGRDPALRPGQHDRSLRDAKRDHRRDHAGCPGQRLRPDQARSRALAAGAGGRFRPTPRASSSA